MKIYYDLHIHSCLSPCGDDDMTPWNLVNMAKISGLDLIALTDHNSCKNCRSAMQVAENVGITVVPGMELCTAEEIHCVCLFDCIDRAENFGEFIKSTMPPIKNREEIFGKQLVMDSSDAIVEREETLLTVASSVGIDSLPALVKKYGGVCFPAHINRSSYSIISSLGDFPPELDVACFELTPDASKEEYISKYKALGEKKLLRNSDAHYLESIREREFYLELKENSPSALIEYLRSKEHE